MKKLATAAAVSIMLLSGTALANEMYLDLGTDDYAVVPPNTADPDGMTGIFDEFGYSGLLATSIYDLTDGTLLGDVFDTNIPGELTAAGIPASGTAMDGVTPVNLVMPNCAAGQCDIDALSPLVPPLGSDSEGFLITWDLQMAYHLDGTLTATGIDYTGGFLDIYFNDLVDDTKDRRVIGLEVTGSTLNAANLDIFFDITFAEEGFLWINNGGTFIDAYDGTVTGEYASMHLDTNVNPPVPGLDQLLVIGTNAIRQATLDGSLTAKIPEPGTLALLGLGLLGFGAASRKKS